MAGKLEVTPPGIAKWCEVLGSARPNRDEPDKNPSWSMKLILDAGDPSHMAWLQEMEDKVGEAIGKKKKSKWAFPWTNDEEAGEVVVRFKLNQFQRRDGSLSEGPTVMDSRKAPWPQSKEIGNGSIVKVAFRLYQWDGPKGGGSGVTFEIAALQVLQHVPYERQDPATAFDVEEGGAIGDEEEDLGSAF